MSQRADHMTHASVRQTYVSSTRMGMDVAEYSSLSCTPSGGGGASVNVSLNRTALSSLASRASV